MIMSESFFILDFLRGHSAMRPVKWILVLAVALSFMAAAFAADEKTEEAEEAEIVLMDFSESFSLDPPPDGWRHRKFWTRSPMEMSFAVKDGVPSLRLVTDDSASMLFRQVNVALADYPFLAWRWHIEQPIESEIDERTEDGDDHPARLFLTFESDDGESRSMEIIWGNRLLQAGDYKYIGDFPHYTANGGMENVGRWHAEEVNLAEIYRKIWGDAEGIRLVDIAIFCDSDETDGGSISYFAEVRARAN